MANLTVTNKYINGWSVLFNIPNTLSWIRIVLIFISIRYFGQRRYLLFVIFHTISGLLDSFDGTLARTFHQYSLVGQYFETILDQYAHIVMYTCIALLYPKYITFFYMEVALELWNSIYNFYIHTLPKIDQTWSHQTTFLSSACSLTIHDHSNFRLFNWYGPDVFHTVLVIRYILLDDNNRRLTALINRYISIHRVFTIIRYTIYFTGFFTILRTYVTSCVLLDKLERLAMAKEIKSTSAI